MKTSIFNGCMLAALLLLTACMKDTPDCTTPTITIVPSSSTCKDTCTVVFQIKEKLADLNKTTFRWNFNDSRVPESTLASPRVFFPGPGEYKVDLTITHPNLYCKALTTTMKFVVDNGDPLARFAMNPATGVCTLGTCAGTCSISFTDQSLNADRVSWTFQGGNGRGELFPVNGKNIVLPPQFNVPDSIQVTLTAVKGAKTSTKSEWVIIRPETYVSKELDISGNSDSEEPFLIAENGGTIYIGTVSGAKISLAQVDRNGIIGASLFNDFSANFSSIIPKVSAIKSNSSSNLYYLAAIALNKSAKSFTIGARIPFMPSGPALRVDTIGPPIFLSEGKCMVEKLAPSSDLLFVGLNRNAGSIEEIVLTSTLPTFGFGLVYPRTTLKGADIDYIIQDGTSYWALLKQRNASSIIENNVVQLDANLKVIATPILIGNNNFIAKRMIKNGNTILLIGNQSGNAQIYGVDIASSRVTSIFSASDWVFNDAILINQDKLLCAGANLVGGKRKAASVAIQISLKAPSSVINYYDVGFNNATFSEIKHISKFSNTTCGLLLTGFVKTGTNPQASFFAKADLNGSL